VLIVLGLHAVLWCLPCAVGDASGNTQSPIDARFKFAPSTLEGHNTSNVTVADSAPETHGDTPCAPQVRTAWLGPGCGSGPTAAAALNVRV
jgi:hypothetical protein